LTADGADLFAGLGLDVPLAAVEAEQFGHVAVVRRVLAAELEGYGISSSRNSPG
jgi:hypothetical protein